MGGGGGIEAVGYLESVGQLLHTTPAHPQRTHASEHTTVAHPQCTHLHNMSRTVQTLLELLPCCVRSERTIVQAARRAARDDGLNSMERSQEAWCCLVRAVETGE